MHRSRCADRSDRPSGRREVVLGLVLLLVYSGIRLVASDDRGQADRNATSILGLERHLGLDLEQLANGWLTDLRWAEVAASYWYAGLHYSVTPLVLVALFRHAPGRYRQARSALVLATAGALVGYLIVPTAPPRMVPGYTDVLLATADVGWWAGDGAGVAGASQVVNELAAMPSMHVGWAVWCALVLASLSRHAWQRALAFGYPLLTFLVVVATANHWVLDAVVGATLVRISWLVTAGAYERLAHPHPVPA